MKRTSWCLLAALAMSGALLGDVDVAVAPGTPLDALWDLPVPTFSARRSVPTVDPKPDPAPDPPSGGTTTTAPRPRKPGRTLVQDPPLILSTDVYRYARITTRDLIGELPWTVRKTEVKALDAYPPPVPDDVLWLALAAVLRLALHSSEVNEAETEAYLVYLGEPSLEALAMASAEPALGNLIARIRGRVTPPPAKRPDPPKGADPTEAMLYRLTWEDLLAGWPAALDGRFAGRVALLGEEMAPYVIQATRSPHPTLRRNATLLLARYQSTAARDRLRELLLDRDPVVRVRAVDGLVRRRERESAPLLARLLQKPPEDAGFVAAVVRALGLLGDPASIAPVAAHLQAKTGDYDTVVTSTVALARLASTQHPLPEALLRSLEGKNRPDPRALLDKYASGAPVNRATTVRQLITLARARSGDAAAWPSVLALQDTGVAGRALAPCAPAAQYLYLETVARHREGPARLWALATSRTEDGSTRLKALAELAEANPGECEERVSVLFSRIGAFEEWAETEVPLAYAGLRILAVLRQEEAARVAARIVDAYRPHLRAAKKALVLEALRILEPQRLVESTVLARILADEVSRANVRPPPPLPPADKAAFVVMLFEAPCPFIEELVTLLGRNPAHRIRLALLDLLAAPGVPGRPEAAVSIASRRLPEDVSLFLGLLQDDDGWVRFMAARGLRALTGKDVPCDWLTGRAEDRRAAATKWADALKKED